MFHVKHHLPMQKSRKIDVEDILDIDFSGQPPQSLGREPQFLRDQFLVGGFR